MVQQINLTKTEKYGWLNAAFAEILAFGAYASMCCNKSAPRSQRPGTQCCSAWLAHFGNVGCQKQKECVGSGGNMKELAT